MSLVLHPTLASADQLIAALLARLRTVEQALARIADTHARAQQRAGQVVLAVRAGARAVSVHADALRREWAAAQRAYREAYWAVHRELVQIGSCVYALPVHPRTQLVQEFFERLNTKLKGMEFPVGEDAYC